MEFKKKKKKKKKSKENSFSDQLTQFFFFKGDLKLPKVTLM